MLVGLVFVIRIFKEDSLRGGKWNEEAYTPQLVSIGPFHHKNERLNSYVCTTKG